MSQGQWKNKFDKDNVYVSDFHVSQSRTCTVNMMYQETRFRYRYFPDDHVQLLEMPYRGDDITMVIILPSRDTTLSKVNLMIRQRLLLLSCSSLYLICKSFNVCVLASKDELCSRVIVSLLEVFTFKKCCLNAVRLLKCPLQAA